MLVVNTSREYDKVLWCIECELDKTKQLFDYNKRERKFTIGDSVIYVRFESDQFHLLYRFSYVGVVSDLKSRSEVNQKFRVAIRKQNNNLESKLSIAVLA